MLNNKKRNVTILLKLFSVNLYLILYSLQLTSTLCIFIQKKAIAYKDYCLNHLNAFLYLNAYAPSHLSFFQGFDHTYNNLVMHYKFHLSLYISQYRAQP